MLPACLRLLREPNRKALWVICLIGVAAGPALPAYGQNDWEQVTQLRQAGRYGEARELMQLLGQSDPDAQQALWHRIRLATDVEEALTAIREAQSRPDLPADVAARLGLEAATIHFARGDFQEALVSLEQLMQDAPDPVRGDIHLLAGMAYWATQQVQKSRESFATVKQSDDAFLWARACLGNIALETGDNTLALRYFESAERSDLAPREPFLLLGAWDARRKAGEPEAADRIQRDIQARFPNSLTAMQLRESLPLPAAETAIGGLPEQEPAVMSEPAAARFQLQLAAFSDRGRALTYLASWQRSLPDVRIVEEPGPDGQSLYKVRTGQFNNRMQAQTEARRLERAHDLKVLIVEGDQ